MGVIQFVCGNVFVCLFKVNGEEINEIIYKKNHKNSIKIFDMSVRSHFEERTTFVPGSDEM